MALFDSIVDEDALRTRLVQPVLQQIAEQTIPAFQKALDESIDRAVTELSNVLHGETLAVQAIADKVLYDVGALIAAQEGWTLNITGTPIKIRLTKPKE